MASIAEGIASATRELLQTYHELNSDQIDEIHEAPSALGFMRYVSTNRPFVVRGGCRHWAASKQWSADYLNDAVGDELVRVAITPHGNADAVVQQEDGTLLFVAPLEQEARFADVLKYIRDQSFGAPAGGLVRYAQTQNDNLRNEYYQIFNDVPPEIPWARIALQKDPDAINFWLGNARTITSLHRDNYENIYAQIRGQKHFVLLPPLATVCVNEQDLPTATYAKAGAAPSLPSEDGLQPVQDQPHETVPWATWDPDDPETRATEFSPLAKPIRVTLGEGDLLYLPSMWYHKVSQSCGQEDFSCAVNYWYDMELAGSFWATSAFVRNTARLKG